MEKDGLAYDWWYCYEHGSSLDLKLQNPPKERICARYRMFDFALWVIDEKRDLL